MSPETFRLLTSSDAVTGYLVGAICLLAIAIVSLAGRRPVPVGGLAVAIAGVAAVALVVKVPGELIGGLLLLILAGLIPARSLLATMALSLPGGTLVAASYVDSPEAVLVVFVVITTVLGAPLVAYYDDLHPDGTGTSLLVISFVGVLLVVPDTDLVIVVAAAAVPLLIAGFPLGLARLGRSGALAATGLLAWTAAAGGAARPAALLAGIGLLGVLAADPVGHMVGESRYRAVGDASRSVERIVLHGLIAIGLAVLLSLTGQPVIIAVFVAGLLGMAWYWSAIRCVAAD